MRNLLTIIGVPWVLLSGSIGLLLCMMSKQARERDEQMNRDEAEGEE